MESGAQLFRPPKGAPFLDENALTILPVAACACDADGAIIQYNRHAVQIWGREPRLGDPAERLFGVRQILRQGERPSSLSDAPVAEALRSGHLQRDVGTVIERPDGSRIRARLDINPVKDPCGAITGAVICFQASLTDGPFEVDDHECLPQAIVAATPECFKLVNRDGMLLHMNAAGLRMIEADDLAQVKGRPAVELVAPYDRAMWLHHHRRVCDGARASWEFDIVGLRGSRRHMETHAAPFALPDGTVGQLAITHDITERKQSEDALRASEERLREILEALPNAVYTTDAEGRISFYNQAAVDMSGRRPELGSDKWCVTWRLYWPDGSPLPHDECPMAIALKEKRAIRGAEAIAERPDGSRVPFIPYPTPLFDEEGKLTGAVNMLVDITDRKKAEAYAERLAAIVAFSDDAIISKDTAGIIQTWNEGAKRLFGYTADEAIGRPVTMLIPPERQDEEPQILARIRRGERIDHYETVRMRKDGSLLDISLTVSPLKDGSGKVIGASKIARDITERRRHEERRRLLVNELNHRVKNTLATVQSLAAQTFRGHASSEVLQQFERRLIALSTAHNILTRESWEGANLDEIVEHAVSAVCAEPSRRFEISGPRRRLEPRAALSLSLALHELCTNAAKYGALANEAGRLRIAWDVRPDGSGERLHLRWEERDGPRVASPMRKGFGSRLLERALARELGAEVQLMFAPTGVVCEIEARIS